MLWWCQLFGYQACSDASTFEAIVMALALAALAYFAFVLILGIFAVIIAGITGQ